ALSPIFSPSSAYSAIFGGAVSGGGSGGTSGAVVDQAALDRLRRRKSMLDALSGEIARLSSSLGASERAKLEAHADSLRQVEQRIAQQEEALNNPGSSGAACTVPSDPGVGSEPLQSSVLHMDLAINAFACDLTRVAAVQFGHHQN